MGPYDNYSISLNASHPYFSYLDQATGKRVYTKESEYNLHNLYGHAQMNVTHREMMRLPDFEDKRLFLLTRSTFAGTGRFASYAVRSKYRTWEQLQLTIPHLMNMNMFGFPHSGADACGYYNFDN